MTEFKEAIPAGGGKITYHFDANKGIAFEVSGFMRALYFVALSMDGRQILCAVPAELVGTQLPSLRKVLPYELCSAGDNALSLLR
jgi:hypothetical protein